MPKIKPLRSWRSKVDSLLLLHNAPCPQVRRLWLTTGVYYPSWPLPTWGPFRLPIQRFWEIFQKHWRETTQPDFWKIGKHEAEQVQTCWHPIQPAQRSRVCLAWAPLQERLPQCHHGMDRWGVGRVTIPKKIRSMFDHLCNNHSTPHDIRIADMILTIHIIYTY